jgi:hypothetical protein
MFGWFKKKEDPKTTEAFQKGRELGAQLMETVERWFVEGLGPYRQYMLKTLDESLFDYGTRMDIPPIYFAKARYSDFLESLDKQNPQVRERTLNALKDWLEVADMTDIRREVDAFLEKNFSEFDLKLRLEGLEKLCERVPMLKDADDVWRRENPELSLQHPPPDDPTFRSDGRPVLPA